MVEDGERRFSIDLIHQKWDAQWNVWRDDAFDLRRVHAGEAVHLELDRPQTARLRDHLNNLFEMNGLIEQDPGRRYRVHRADRPPLPDNVADVVRQLMEASPDPETFALNLAQLAPDLAAAAAVVHEQAVRTTALDHFRTHLDALDWSEAEWQAFFEANDWIFGHGLAYQFLVTEETQPAYGGQDITGQGGQRGDFLMATQAEEARFSVLVEIKKPNTPLIGGERYRNGAWRVSDELAGGVAQLQTNCRQWETQARQLPNVEVMAERGITTADPKGILLIGRTRALTDREKKESFERFRQHLWNPEVLTYDELFERARFIVQRTAPATGATVGGPDAQDGGEPAAEPERPLPDEDDYDDLPF